MKTGLTLKGGGGGGHASFNASTTISSESNTLTKCLSNVGAARRRWANNKSTLGQCIISTGFSLEKANSSNSLLDK